MRSVLGGINWARVLTVWPVACVHFAASLACSCCFGAEDCKKWSPMIVNYASKSIAMVIAFALQSRISAIQSAAMGGQIFARSLLQLGRERGLVTIAADETYMDEVVGWSVAVIGERFPLDSRHTLT